MTKPERPPISEAYLTRCGPPTVLIPAHGIVAVMSGDGYETVDMTFEQAVYLYNQLEVWIEHQDDYMGR